MNEKALIVLVTTILAGIGSAAVMVWAWTNGLTLGDTLSMFLGACMTSFLLVIKSPLEKG